jgi:hypothetical protein
MNQEANGTTGGTSRTNSRSNCVEAANTKKKNEKKNKIEGRGRSSNGPTMTSMQPKFHVGLQEISGGVIRNDESPFSPSGK